MTCNRNLGAKYMRDSNGFTSVVLHAVFVCFSELSVPVSSDTR